MSDAIMNGAFIRRKMKELGLRQKDIAAAMNLPQSAISNIIKGTRRIKVDEAERLFPILGADRQLSKEMAVIPISDIQQWKDARRITRLLVYHQNPSWSSKTFTVEMDAGDDSFLPGLIHVVVDPERKQLFKNGLYLVEGPSGIRFFRYQEAPSRFVPMPPFTEDPMIEVGREPFSVIGEVQSVMKRPDVLPPYGEG